MVQRRAARWVLGRYDRLDSVTDMLSSLKWRSLELRRPDVRFCRLYKQSNGIATYECDKLQKEAEWTPGSRFSVIDLSSHVIHVIIIRIIFTLGQLLSGINSHHKI